ncbi:MAG: ABC transporter ATP-binding protein [Elusimicrobiaceae bacterium]|jgi:ABC-2 type transport system ATP-binding protein
MPNNNGGQAVAVNGLTVAFGSFRAVDGISFSVPKGEIFGFLGANGAGKTTTIRALCGLITPSGGELLVAGIDVAKDPMAVKRRIGYMSQKFTLYPDLSVRENLAFAAALRKIPRQAFEKRSRELLEFVGFSYPEDTLAGKLPGGMKQQVALAASILHDPEIIFLDEPTAGVAPQERSLFWKLIRAMSAEGKTVFVTTHYMDEAEQCARIALMQSGRIAALDSPASLKKANYPDGLYEIALSGPDLLASLKACGKVSPYGLKWHAEILDGPAWDAFRARAGGGAQIRRIAPSLEDVFLKVIGEN